MRLLHGSIAILALVFGAVRTYIEGASVVATRNNDLRWRPGKSGRARLYTSPRREASLFNFAGGLRYRQFFCLFLGRLMVCTVKPLEFKS